RTLPRAFLSLQFRLSPPDARLRRSRDAVKKSGFFLHFPSAFVMIEAEKFIKEVFPWFWTNRICAKD
ncbi:MAG: hypothetical protein II771_04955, partial [Clostridia bacterium]|nr:hypothetical protein [Clostridia bacterium]